MHGKRNCRTIDTALVSVNTRDVVLKTAVLVSDFLRSEFCGLCLGLGFGTCGLGFDLGLKGSVLAGFETDQ